MRNRREIQRKKLTIREKLELLKEIERRNEQRRKAFAEKERRDEQARKEFAEKERRNRRLLDLYVKDIITKEEFEEKIKR